jgi:SOS-response transcriptional repressor LexA
MRDLPSDHQHAVLSFVASHMQSVQCPPTRREIAEHFSFPSENSATQALDALERKGYIVKRSNVSRGLQLTDKAREYLASKAPP